MKRVFSLSICLVFLVLISCCQQKESGLFLIRQNDLYGFINKTGKIVVKPQFEEAESFSEGLAPVMIDKNYGYIDKTGKTVIEPQYDDVMGSFSAGLAAVKKGGKWGYVDKKGKIVIEPQFDVASPFSEGLALVVIEFKCGYASRAKIQDFYTSPK